MIRVVAVNTVREECLEAFLQAIPELVALTRRESGCMEYGLNSNMDHPERLTFIERWKSMEYLQAHMASEHFRRIIPILGKCCIGEMDVNIYTELV